MSRERVIAPGPDAAAAPACEGHAGCVTCGDEAIAMGVLRVDRARGLALCEDDTGARSSVEIALVEPVQTGDVLLVHAGTAIAHAAATGRAASAAAPGLQEISP